jgi:hypothetical protein
VTLTVLPYVIFLPFKFYFIVNSQNYVMSPERIYQPTTVDSFVCQPVTDVEDTSIGNVTLDHEIGDLTVVMQ